MEPIYCVYAYLREDGTPYYVGKGTKQRAHTRHPTANGSNLTPKDRSKIIFLHTGLIENEAFSLERRYIKLWGRKDIGTGILRNRTDGGEGTSGRDSSAIRDKLRGFVFTEERKRNISLSLKGKPSPRKGVILSEETKRKIGDANRGRKRSAECIAKMKLPRGPRGPYKKRR
jgi:NUMOD3 motif-containing protein